MCSRLDTRTPPGLYIKMLFYLLVVVDVVCLFVLISLLCYYIYDACALIVTVSNKLPPQILVPLRGLLLRALHMETGVHSGCIHGGSFRW